MQEKDEKKDNGNDKTIIEYIREKEMVSRLFTLESTVFAIYSKACETNDLDEFKQWLRPKLKKIEVEKTKYSRYVMEHPLSPTLECLDCFQKAQ